LTRRKFQRGAIGETASIDGFSSLGRDTKEKALDPASSGWNRSTITAPAA